MEMDYLFMGSGTTTPPTAALYFGDEIETVHLETLLPPLPLPDWHPDNLPGNKNRKDSPTLPKTDLITSPTDAGDNDDMKKFAGKFGTKSDLKTGASAFEVTSAMESFTTTSSTAQSSDGRASSHITTENKAAYVAYVRGKATGYGTYGAAIPEPDGPEFCYPEYGARPNITADAQIWYVGVRFMLKWGINYLKFADGKYIDVLVDTYPLRDTLNKMMWDDCLEAPEGAALVRLGRIYARAQGEAKDGVVINGSYIERTGLSDMSNALLDIFRREAIRRGHPLPDEMGMQRLTEAIDELQVKVALDLKERETLLAIDRVASAEKAAQELIQQEEQEKYESTSKRTSQSSSKKSKPKGKSKKGKGKK